MKQGHSGYKAGQIQKIFGKYFFSFLFILGGGITKKMKQKIVKQESVDLEDILDIARGHEIWLEYDKHKIRVGEKAECKLGFGDKMKSERAVNVEKVKAIVFNPQNEKYDLDIDVGDRHLIIPFAPEHKGYYTIVVEYDGGILDLTHAPGPKYYCQYAKTIVTVGHGSGEYELITGQELEIMPLNFKKHYHTGDKVAFQVLYEGAALPDEAVNAICDSCEESIEMKTNSKGKATIELNTDGNWMFMVRHKDPEKGVKGLYEEKAMTTTFTVNCQR